MHMNFKVVRTIFQNSTHHILSIQFFLFTQHLRGSVLMHTLVHIDFELKKNMIKEQINNVLAFLIFSLSKAIPKIINTRQIFCTWIQYKFDSTFIKMLPQCDWVMAVSNLILENRIFPTPSTYNVPMGTDIWYVIIQKRRESSMKLIASHRDAKQQNSSTKTNVLEEHIKNENDERTPKRVSSSIIV